MKSVDDARREADEWAPKAAEFEAEYYDLRRREPSVLARCVEKYRTPTQTYQWAKNQALMDHEYQAHLDRMKAAQERFLEAEKAFKTLIEYIKALTSANYLSQAKVKAGIL